MNTTVDCQSFAEAESYVRFEHPIFGPGQHPQTLPMLQSIPPQQSVLMAQEVRGYRKSELLVHSCLTNIGNAINDISAKIQLFTPGVLPIAIRARSCQVVNQRNLQMLHPVNMTSQPYHDSEIFGHIRPLGPTNSGIIEKRPPQQLTPHHPRNIAILPQACLKPLHTIGGTPLLSQNHSITRSRTIIEITSHHIDVFSNSPNKQLNGIQLQPVVAVVHQDPFAGSIFDSRIASRGKPLVAVVTHDSDLRGALRKLGEHLLQQIDTSVGRTIIDKNILNIGISLTEQCTSAPFDIKFHAIDGNQQGNKRLQIFH